MKISIKIYLDLTDGLSPFLVRTGDDDRESLEEPLCTACDSRKCKIDEDLFDETNVLFPGFLSLSDSDSDDESDDSEPDDEESELDPEDDLFDGERAGFLVVDGAFVGEGADLSLSLLFAFFALCGDGEGGGESEAVGDFPLDLDDDCSFERLGRTSSR